MKRRGKKWYFAPHSESISNIQYRFLSLVLAISWGISMDSNSSRKIANYRESRSMAFGNSLSYMYVCASFFVLACCCCLLVTKVPSSPNKFFCVIDISMHVCIEEQVSIEQWIPKVCFKWLHILEQCPSLVALFSLIVHISTMCVCVCVR